MSLVRQDAVNLAISGTHYEELRRHLFPGDGLEAVAFGLCGRSLRDGTHTLFVRELFCIPHTNCSVRTPSRVTWSGADLDPILQKALGLSLGLVKFHSHPGGFKQFSDVDDASDRLLFSSVEGWLLEDSPNASAIMLPDGELFGRCMWGGEIGAPLSKVRVAGPSFLQWPLLELGHLPDSSVRFIQAFGESTYRRMRATTIGIVGCSGTGSLVVEQLARNAVGKLVLVDPDVVEEKNLNRIVNSSLQDAEVGADKVDVLARSVREIGLNTEVETYSSDLRDRSALLALSKCDVLFGCMDSVDGRHVLNKLASAYLIPYIDVGVRLEADGKGGIDSIWIAIHTLLPGGSSLKSRQVYNQEDLEAAFLARSNPQEYQRLRDEGYIKGVLVDRPAVVSVNMTAAAAAVNEMLARIHGFRVDRNERFAIRRICISDEDASHSAGEGKACSEMGRVLGCGDTDPLLGMLGLEQPKC